MNEEFVKYLYKGLEISNNGVSYVDFYNDLQNPEFQRIVYDNTNAEADGISFEEFRSDLGFTAPVEQKPTGFFQAATNALQRGWAMGGAAQEGRDIAVGGDLDDEEVARVIEMNQQMEKYGASDEYKDFTEAQGWGDSVRALAKAPVKIATELAAESLAAFVRIGKEEMGAAALTGAGIGAALGPAGAATAAAAGVALSSGAAFASSYQLEAGIDIVQTIQEEMRERGLDVNSVEDWQTMLQDKEMVASARQRANTRGLIVGAVDAVFAGIAGKILTGSAKSKFVKGLATTATEGTGGATGEVLASVAVGDEITAGSVMAEFIGEIGSGSATTATTLVTDRVRKKSRDATRGKNRNRSDEQIEDTLADIAVSGDPDAMQKMEEEIAGALEMNRITKGEADDLRSRLSDLIELNQSIPEDVSDADRRKKIINLMKQREQIDATLQEEKAKKVDEAFKDEQQAKVAQMEQQKDQINEQIRAEAAGETVQPQRVEPGPLQEEPLTLGEPQHTVLTGQEEADFREKSKAKKPGSRLVSEPAPQAKAVSEQYKKAKGLPVTDDGLITKLDVDHQKQIADAYEAMENNPNDPEVAQAYEQLAQETLDQYRMMADSGVVFEIYEGQGEPYANSEEMIQDVRENNHMYILSTEKDFGQEAITDQQRQENPLLRDSGVTDVNGKPLLMNDIFRGVHDYFGHAVRGNSFGAIGEENAWAEHVRMYTPLAARAMTTETRGQNSWVNFGPHLRNPDGRVRGRKDPGYLPATERPFAEQKIGLLPEWASQPPAGEPVSPEQQEAAGQQQQQGPQDRFNYVEDYLLQDRDVSLQVTNARTGEQSSVVMNALEAQNNIKSTLERIRKTANCL